jgi:hypothetical protein
MITKQVFLTTQLSLLNLNLTNVTKPNLAYTDSNLTWNNLNSPCLTKPKISNLSYPNLA